MYSRRERGIRALAVNIFFFFFLVWFLFLHPLKMGLCLKKIPITIFNLQFPFGYFFLLFLVFRDKGFSVLKKTRVGIRHGGADLLSHHTVSASINVAK